MRRSLVMPVVLAIVLAACGGGGGASGAGAVELGEAVETSEVTIDARAFSPASIVVAVGTKVTWTNKDKTSHSVTAGEPGRKTGEFDRTFSPSVGGNTPQFSYTFDQAGIYTYYCQFHTQMRGQVEVK